MIIVIGTGRARTGCRERLIAAMRDITAPTLAEDGCLGYRFAVDIDDPDVIVGVEVWRDQAALDAHMALDHTRAFLAVAPDLLDGPPDMQIFRTEAPR